MLLRMFLQMLPYLPVPQLARVHEGYAERTKLFLDKLVFRFF